MMITGVLSHKDQKVSKEETYDKLVALNPNDRYKKQKASGSIGGSRTQGYITIDGNDYRCTRDATK